MQPIMDSISRYFSPLTEGRHTVRNCKEYENLITDSAEVIVLNNVYSDAGGALYKQLLHQAWSKLTANGLFIVCENLCAEGEKVDSLDHLVAEFGEISYYSSIAPCKIETQSEISQYLLAVEENLRQEEKKCYSGST